MSSFLYLVTEGVHDVAFLGKLLSVGWGASRIRTMDELDEAHRSWIGEFKWPSFHRGKAQIDRLAVPAPVFYRFPEGTVVALRNAQGLSEIGKTLTVDVEAFARISSNPDAIGIVLDSDDEPAEQRFRKVKATLKGVSLEAPPALGEVTTGTPRLGVFALPEPGVAGTLEDLLLALGDAAYPALAAAARGYAAEWRARAETEPTVVDWKEMRKPAGTKKAAIAAMTAILKPGRSTQASLEDHNWVSGETKVIGCIQPCVAFLNALLTIRESVPGNPA